TPLLEKIAALSGHVYQGEDAVAMRVIADHLRALSFAIADGAQPSNEGRGYVLRRLLRRAARFGRRLGFDRPILGELFPTLESGLSGVFPELRRERDRILRALRSEEEGFLATLDRGLALFEDAARRAAASPGRTFPGEEAFRLYDTFGFPIDLTRMMAAEQNLQLDEAGFEEKMRGQKDRARKARRDASVDSSTDAIAGLISGGLRCEFLGYGESVLESRILALLRNGERVETARVGEEVEALPEKTPFYAEAGGQVTDTGRIAWSGGAAEVLRVRKPADGIQLHKIRIVEGSLRIGETIRLEVDDIRRAQCRRHHTSTHLLHAALRATAGDSVKQAGSYVAPDRLRFDFASLEALSQENLDQIEEQVNLWILENRPVQASEIPFREIPGSNIVALFDEKYGDVVRVVDVKGVSRECCGGTHVDTTGQIGSFRILSESSVAAGIRRIEALAGTSAETAARQDRSLLRDLAQRFSVAPAELPARVDQILEQNRKLERELRKALERDAANRAADLEAKIHNIGGIPVLIESIGSADAEALRTLSDALKSRLPDAVLILATVGEGKVDFTAAAGEPAVARGIHCGKMVAEMARLTGGGGGGRPNRAHAGGKDPTRLEAALEAAREQVRKILE
ncbi:MAG: alanine--tRNA ligase, partial [Kiritimatiellia bacterium]|nr:alanine--tRNA ligase [Kiritimatiellia bacterium]